MASTGPFEVCSTWQGARLAGYSRTYTRSIVVNKLIRSSITRLAYHLKQPLHWSLQRRAAVVCRPTYVRCRPVYGSPRDLHRDIYALNKAEACWRLSKFAVYFLTRATRKQIVARMQRLLKRSSGHDWGPIILDPLAWAYIAVAVLSSVALFFGISCLIYYRHLDCVRVRNIALMTASLVAIHVYLVIALLNYPLNGEWPCSAGYWVMGFYLPIGVALFQAQNVQLLSLSALQKELTFESSTLRKRPRWRALVRFQIRWEESNLLDRMYLSIGVGFFLQVRPSEIPETSTTLKF